MTFIEARSAEIAKILYRVNSVRYYKSWGILVTLCH